MPSSGFTVGQVSVNVLSADQLIAELRSRMLAGRGAAVATLNLDHVVKLGSDPLFRQAYAAHDLVTADGFPIVVAGRLQRAPVVRTAGSDLIFPIAALAAEVGVGVALIGSTEDSLEKAGARLRLEHPALQIAFQESPPFGFDPAGADAERLAVKLRDSGSRVCFVALGAPKQEIFAARLRLLAPGVCVVSIGAGLDFLSGHQVRAPRLFRTLNLEWAWRLIGNPRRLTGRYARSVLVLPGLIAGALRERLRA